MKNDGTTKLLSAAWRTNPTAVADQRSPLRLQLGAGDLPRVAGHPELLSHRAAFTNPMNTYRTQGRNTDTYNFADNANWVKGKHTLAFGAQGQLVRIEQYNDAGITPTYTLGLGTNTGLTTAQLPGVSASRPVGRQQSALHPGRLHVCLHPDLQRVLAGTRASSTAHQPAPQQLRQLRILCAGLLDSLSRRLTVTLGLRWDYYPPVEERTRWRCSRCSKTTTSSRTMLIRTPRWTSPARRSAGPGTSRTATTSRRTSAWRGIPPAKASGPSARGYSLAFVNDDSWSAPRTTAKHQRRSRPVRHAPGPGGLLSRRSHDPTPAFKVPRTLGRQLSAEHPPASAFPARTWSRHTCSSGPSVSSAPSRPS